MTLDFNDKIKASNEMASSSTLLNIGYFYLQHIYNDLSISDFFGKVTEGMKNQFDPNLVNRFLTYERILDPGSKLHAYKRMGRYYEKPAFEYVHILRTMDILEEHYDEYISHLFEQSSKIVKRNTSVCYYDCTNYYFEVESQDADYVDEVTGEVVKGLRKYGVSKEHRPNPIVEMGLFMDSNGIPLSMCITSGSSNEQTTAIPLEKKLARMLSGKEFIYCADSGLGSYNIRNFNAMGGRSFVVTQSIKKLSGRLQEAVFSDCDYRLLSDDRQVSLSEMKSFDKHDSSNEALYIDTAYKIVDADNLVDLGLYEEVPLKGGKKKKRKAKGVLKQKLVITYSRKMMEYQRFVRNRQIGRAKKMLESIDPETYKKGPHDVTRFIKRTSTGKSGEKADDKYTLDHSLIEEEEKYDGFYAVATNLEDDAKTIIGINSQRYKIEECFRILKTNFSSRPVYHQNRERIIAHFMICYTALLVYRLLEVKLKEQEEHITTDNIIETLRNMDIANVDDIYYLSTYKGSKTLTALNAVFGMELNNKYFLPKELNKKIRKISK